jgi:hypothetical protein
MRKIIQIAFEVFTDNGCGGDDSGEGVTSSLCALCNDETIWALRSNFNSTTRGWENTWKKLDYPPIPQDEQEARSKGTDSQEVVE